MLIVPNPQFKSFKREKGKRVIVEYVVMNQNKLEEANLKWFPEVPSNELVEANEDILEDFTQAMTLCKTHIADPLVFDLCRKIEVLIKQIMLDRFTYQGKDCWVFEEKPLDKED